MAKEQQPEVWMRGPLPNIPSMLQPVAHALLQAEEDILRYVEAIDSQKLWERPQQVASIAFHIQHIVGVIDRMFTYARQEALNEEQLHYLAQEGQYSQEVSKQSLLKSLRQCMENALQELTTFPLDELGDVRYLGRKRIPTTLIGLLFHAAEHSQRHVGQLVVTARWVTG